MEIVDSNKQATQDIEADKERADKQHVDDVKIDTADFGKQDTQDVKVDEAAIDTQAGHDIQVDADNVEKEAAPAVKDDEKAFEQQALPDSLGDLRSDKVMDDASIAGSRKQEVPSEIVIDGTVFPAEYFGGEIVSPTVTKEPMQTSGVESTPLHVATSETTTSIQPTQTMAEPTEEITQQTFDHQSQATQDVSEETLVQKSDKVMTQESQERTIQETESKRLKATSSDSYSVMSTETETVKADLKIEPSETAIEKSAPPGLNANLPDTHTVPVDKITDPKPLIMQATNLKPSSNSVYSSIDLKKFETPYQASTKVLPLNQGVDINNKYTPALDQSSIETSATHTDTESSVAQGVEIPKAEVRRDNVTVQSDSVQDKVQPSLSQDPYKTVDFVARKTLSAEHESVRKEPEGQPDVQRQQPYITKPPEIKQAQDQTKHMGDPHRQLPDLPGRQGGQQEQAAKETEVPVQTTPTADKMDLPVPPTLRPKVDENNNLGDTGFGADPSQTQKLGDERQDVAPELSLVQRLEPQLKLLVDKVQ